MIGKYSYLLWLAVFVWLPTLALWLTSFGILKHYKRTLSFCIFWALVFSIPWDIIAVKTRLWTFPRENSVGLWVAGLPLEEYLFITSVTFMIATMALVLKHKIRYANE